VKDLWKINEWKGLQNRAGDNVDGEDTDNSRNFIIKK
jgi:hypothetical protein